MPRCNKVLFAGKTGYIGAARCRFLPRTPLPKLEKIKINSMVFHGENFSAHTFSRSFTEFRTLPIIYIFTA